MSNLYLKLKGADELARSLEGISEGFEKKAIVAANKKVAEVVVKRALPNVPVLTGALKSSVRALAGQKKANVKAGSKAVPYAEAIHWGKFQGSTKGRPFLWDAKNAALASGEVEAAYTEACDDLINQFF